MKVFVAGHGGMVGSAVLRQLQRRGDIDLLTAISADLDLTDQRKVAEFLQDHRPDAVILAAAKVGGIMANKTYPAQFIYENMMIASNVIHQSYAAGVTRLLQIASSAIYPPTAPQPMSEDALFTAPLDQTHAPYAMAKIAAITLCDSYNRQYGTDYRTVVPTNLYGPGDNFHPENSHVLPALIRKFHAASLAGKPTVTLWGSGTPRREFMHVDDMAAACLHVHNLPCVPHSHVNVGTGTDVTIAEVATIIAEITGYTGEIIYDASKPDGAMRKLMDVSRLTALGWASTIPLRDGITQTYQWFLKQNGEVRAK